MGVQELSMDEHIFTDAAYTYDIIFIEELELKSQELFNVISNTAEKLGLYINVKIMEARSTDGTQINFALRGELIESGV